MRIDRFFTYARLRYQVMLDKNAGKLKPWTLDEILQQYRFCNIFREDDTTTKWIRERVTLKGYGSKLLGAMIIARWFNRVETLERMRGTDPHNNLLYSWSEDIDAWTCVMHERLGDVHPLVTGAYMIKTPAKMNKLKGLLDCLRKILPDTINLSCGIEPGETTLQEVTEILTGYPYLGPFMAYEVVTDLRHSILSEAPDIMTWANPGPGCARGLGRVMQDNIGYYNRHKSMDVDKMMDAMQKILKVSQNPVYWPVGWPKWEMRDVEHTLCEFDKYERARLGDGKPKQRYKGAA